MLRDAQRLCFCQGIQFEDASDATERQRLVYIAKFRLNANSVH